VSISDSEFFAEKKEEREKEKERAREKSKRGRHARQGEGNLVNFIAVRCVNPEHP